MAAELASYEAALEFFGATYEVVERKQAHRKTLRTDSGLRPNGKLAPRRAGQVKGPPARLAATAGSEQALSVCSSNFDWERPESEEDGGPSNDAAAAATGLSDAAALLSSVLVAGGGGWVGSGVGGADAFASSARPEQRQRAETQREKLPQREKLLVTGGTRGRTARTVRPASAPIWASKPATGQRSAGGDRRPAIDRRLKRHPAAAPTAAAAAGPPCRHSVARARRAAIERERLQHLKHTANKRSDSRQLIPPPAAPPGPPGLKPQRRAAEAAVDELVVAESGMAAWAVAPMAAAPVADAQSRAVESEAEIAVGEHVILLALPHRLY